MADRTLGFSRVLQATGASMGLACASRLGNAIDLIETTHFQGSRTFISKKVQAAEHQHAIHVGYESDGQEQGGVRCRDRDKRRANGEIGPCRQPTIASGAYRSPSELQT